ncbi:hypothetical protein LEAN103870_07640 [Legionella anisa]|uniref:Uncharacterized protein n=1 Tax=Legionella anisa TaxID=28082 RepID=A0AAX0WTC0_9GAMM|nr:hypothetical protein [Legionella anisa]AWN74521.1 hypothetical protein DLD14_12065 [Legionella anisa]KTC76585.1 hypothetical protein Lani_0315 [Legionella anisa]MCW8425365.1 hypothetical protein [Legionella anisa]MCW8449204.1 hypothetical protein [Legionella anisa]PNL61584.1 hypothetical protein A6J39_010385 [Legionella anisa]
MTKTKLNDKVSRREQFHQKIAKLLEEKPQTTISDKWTANAKGVFCEVDWMDYRAAKASFDKQYKEAPPNSSNLIHDHSLPVPYIAHYTEPSNLIQLLKLLGEDKMAKEYEEMIKEENLQIAAKLNQLMQKDGIEWKADERGVFCTHSLEIPSSEHPGEKGQWAFIEKLESYGITALPSSLRGSPVINGEEQPRKVKIEANYSDGESLEDLNGRLDIELAKKANADKSFSMKSRLIEMREDVQSYPPVFGKIIEFCNNHPKVDGLQTIQSMLKQAPLSKSYDTAFNEVIELAQWKKSDTELSKGFHQKFRGRDPEVEDFYQKLAALNPRDKESVSQFEAYMEEHTPKESYGYGS